MITKPIVIMPFVFIAFLELLALEFLFFASRVPLSYIANPIVRKFFGEAFIHYPGTLVVLPKLFYIKQLAIYIVFGAFLTAVTVNIFKNIKRGLPVRANAMVKNTLKSYTPLALYAILLCILVFILQKVDTFVVLKTMKLLSKVLPMSLTPIYSIGLPLLLFLSNLIMQTFLIATIPIIVIEKAPLLKALGRSITLGFKNFFTIFFLIFLPFFIYLPIILLKGLSSQIMDRTFPEMGIYITVVGIIATMLLDSFAILAISQFILDKKKATVGKTT
jgi:hypothetical protein